MNTIIPIIIPSSRREPTCPSCGKVESKKEVCNHCGYEYEEENEKGSSDGIFIFRVIMTIIIGVWILLTLMEWTIPMEDDNITLVEVLKNQWEWIKDLLNRIK